MTPKEQRNSCEVCPHHKIINAQGGFWFMSCHYGDYKNHPVWGDFKCPLGNERPIRENDNSNFL